MEYVANSMKQMFELLLQVACPNGQRQNLE